MKKFLSLVLAAACMPMMLLASCASGGAGAYSPKITVASSDAEDSAEFLTDRLGDKLTDNVYLAVGSDTANGIDMTDFENDGYVLRTVGDKSVVIVGKSADGLDLGVRRYANSVDDGKDEYFDVAYHEGYRIENFTLAGTDIAEYSIEYPAEHNENMLFAVSELQRLVKKACGAELSASEGITKKARAIEFRHSTDAELKFDGYRYFFEGERLVIEGAVKRGCMYGVWRFLQKECGWTSLIYGDSDLLEAEHLDVPATASRQETPVFSYLNMYWNGWGSYNDDKGYPNTVQNSYGIMPQCCHGLYRFSEVNVMGKQICYTDEDIYELCRDNIRSYIESRLQSGQVIGREFLSVDISQNDSGTYCTCRECMKVFSVEGSNSGAVVRFANRLSEELNEDYPGLYYQIFAYAESNAAPLKTKPNEFVHITFCSDMNCSNHVFDGSECNGRSTFNMRNNKNYAAWLESWCKVSDNVYVWFYALDSVLQQYTTIDNMYRDFRYFRDLGINGMFWMCEFYGLGIQRVQHQLLAELQWNMDISEGDFEYLLCDILKKEFGSGWSSVREYIRMWDESQKRIKCWHCWGGWDYPWDTRYDGNYYDDHFETMVSLLEDAVTRADSKAQQIRAENFTCHMYYEGCYSLYYKAEAAGDTALMKTLSDRYDLMMERLYKNGFDPCGIGIRTVDGNHHRYDRTIQEAAVNGWIGNKENVLKGITGKEFSGYANED